jgi:hypothetical protein
LTKCTIHSGSGSTVRHDDQTKWGTKSQVAMSGQNATQPNCSFNEIPCKKTNPYKVSKKQVTYLINTCIQNTKIGPTPVKNPAMYQFRIRNRKPTCVTLIICFMSSIGNAAKMFKIANCCISCQIYTFCWINSSQILSNARKNCQRGANNNFCLEPGQYAETNEPNVQIRAVFLQTIKSH